MVFSAGGALFDDFRRDVRAMSRHLPERLFSRGESISGAAAAGVPVQTDRRCLCPIVFPSLRFPLSAVGEAGHGPSARARARRL